MILALSIAGIVIAVVPAAMFLSNLPLFLFSANAENVSDPPLGVSVLIPARDEADSIAGSILAAVACDGVDVEVVVLDDHSSDGTDEVVKRIAASDARVRYLPGGELPAGWNGKQHACWQLAAAATHDRMVFLDADVRLRPDALKRLADRQDATGVALLSAFPHQQTGTTLEKWIIPLMHFILLGFLPFTRMRTSCDPAYAAGCGQLFMTRRQDYRQAGTHEAIAGSRHDGLKLPRIDRQAGLMTDVVDGTDLADCRMYHSAGEVVRGVLKNAVEGIANPKLIAPFTIMLIGGSVLPLITLVWSAVDSSYAAMIVSVIGVIVGHLPRAIAAVRFRQSALGVLCHAPATLVFVMLQWVALLMHLTGHQVAWRGRS